MTGTCENDDVLSNQKIQYRESENYLPTEITSSTAVNSTTFANTPFTFANTNGGSGIGAPVAVQVASQYGNKHISFYLGTTFSGGTSLSGLPPLLCMAKL